MKTSEELAIVIEKLITEEVSNQMEILEETYFAKSQQTLFTLQELADKWGCSKGHVHRILKKYNVEPIGKRGKENEYDGSRAEEVKAIHDGKVIYQDKLDWKMRAM